MNALNTPLVRTLCYQHADGTVEEIPLTITRIEHHDGTWRCYWSCPILGGSEFRASGEDPFQALLLAFGNMETLLVQERGFGKNICWLEAGDDFGL